MLSGHALYRSWFPAKPSMSRDPHEVGSHPRCVRAPIKHFLSQFVRLRNDQGCLMRACASAVRAVVVVRAFVVDSCR